MNNEDYDALLKRLKLHLTSATGQISIGIVGFTSVALNLVWTLTGWGFADRITGIYDLSQGTAPTGIERKRFEELSKDRPDIVIIASDENKEQLLTAAIPHLLPVTKIVIGGFSHFEFRDAAFDREVANSLIPSFANGYPNTLIHIYQCLQNAARQDLKGIVAEFGMFKGGTTMLISRFVEKLGKSWKVYGFDSFSGFPAPRSPLDMYSHPDCVFLDEAAVRRAFEGRNVEIIAGDIARTVDQIKNNAVVLAFIDTDNFTPANAVLDVIQNNVALGGAIVFDHFTGRNRFLYTLGERLSAKRLLADSRYFNLHDTGVFLRVR